MKATELRIGNIIQWNGIIATVVGISINGNAVIDVKYDKVIEHQTFTVIETILLSYSKHSEKCIPIPLTEELLVRFGFKKDPRCVTGKNFHLLNFMYYLDDSSFNTYMCFECGGTNIKCEHVHQLQNLYFALTGEELVYQNLTAETPPDK